MRRSGRAVVTAAVVVALFAPVALNRDDFPLSVYPMYSRARSSESTIATAHRIDDRGVEHRLSLDLIGQSDDPLVVAGELRAAIAADRADERCAEIARRAATAGAEDGDLIEVVMERHDVVDHVNDEPSLVERTVHATCSVGAW